MALDGIPGSGELPFKKSYCVLNKEKADPSEGGRSCQTERAVQHRGSAGNTSNIANGSRRTSVWKNSKKVEAQVPQYLEEMAGER